MNSTTFPRSRRLLGMLVAVAVAVIPIGLLAAPASAQASVTKYQSVIPVTGTQSGCTEFIDYSGSGLTRFSVVTDAAGGQHIDDFFLALQGVSGLGETSGATYHVVGVQSAGVTNNLTSNNGVETFTGVTHYKFVGSGPENNETVNIFAHVTFVNGVIITQTFDFSVSCGNG